MATRCVNHTEEALGDQHSVVVWCKENAGFDAKSHEEKKWGEFSGFGMCLNNQAFGIDLERVDASPGLKEGGES